MSNRKKCMTKTLACSLIWKVSTISFFLKNFFFFLIPTLFFLWLNFPFFALFKKHTWVTVSKCIRRTLACLYMAREKLCCYLCTIKKGYMSGIPIFNAVESIEKIMYREKVSFFCHTNLFSALCSFHLKCKAFTRSMFSFSNILTNEFLCKESVSTLLF